MVARVDGGERGALLPGDVGPELPVEPWAALLPALDPTTMGWKSRGFYLDAADVPYLFATAGNGGTTAWWDGRIVGCWVQDDDAARLTDWLGGVRHTSVYAARQSAARPLP